MVHRYVRFCLLFVLLLINHYQVGATHIYGGDLLYEHVSGDDYKVSLTIYGDCSGVNFPFLDGASPVLDVNVSGNPFITVSLFKEAGYGKEVTPVCPQDSNNTACKRANAPLPGISKFVYSTIVNIPFPDKDWVFVFAGATSPGSAGRTNSIGNIFVSQANGSLMYLEAHLNNTKGPNSSPKYTTIPTPFFCVNKQQEYNQGAVDPDNDSLNFLLIAPLESSTTTVTYISPFTATEPLATATGSFAYNNVNGQMSFIPNRGQISLVANKVEEYKNGELIGSSMREMTFIVLTNCDNSPPVGKIDSNITGGAATPGNTINVCSGTTAVAFTVTPVDDNNNNIIITSPGTNFGGTVTISNNNTTHPRVEFNWLPAPNQPLGAYTFFLNYKDDGCPLSSNQTVAYTIKIVKNFSISHEVLQPTQCIHNAFVRLSIQDGVSPKVITILQKDKIIASYFDSVHKDSDPLVLEDSFKKGRYQIIVSSPYLPCSTSYFMDIVDSGTYPYPPKFKNRNECLNDLVTPIELRTDTTSFIINWYDTAGNKLPGVPTYATNEGRIYTWKISQTHLVCESEKVDYALFVHLPPIVEVLNKPTKVCIGDPVYLMATGAVFYKWLPADQVYSDANGSKYTKVITPTTYSVIGASAYGCLDTADVTYTDIENCCTFSYPNAFTPNGDGKNDGFKAILYGNASEYLFAVYNRWGQEVFRSSSPSESWDGTFNGKACEVGTYFYRVKGKCLTGHEENGSGDFLLIR